MLSRACPECGTPRLKKSSLKKYEGYTMDCKNCGLMLILEEGKLKDFHAHLNASNPNWPKDGEGTSFISLGSDKVSTG